MSLRVLVVDDTAVFRRIVCDALSALPGVEVVGTAPNGKIALSYVESLRPDLMTLDVEMPEMGGIEVLEALAKSGSKTGAIVLSAHTVRGGQLTVRALELGAFDFLPKPEGGRLGEDNLTRLRADLAPIVKAFQRRHEVRTILSRSTAPSPSPARNQAAQSQPASARSETLRPAVLTGAPIVLIGISTGGPAALATVLPLLPASLPAPVFIVQHMPPLFTDALASSLAGKCSLRVKEGTDGEVAQPGSVYIAPGGRHMKISRGPSNEIIVNITDDAPENNCRPAVDYLFRSAALNFPGRSVAVIMTGMGNDGTRGLQMLKRSGCISIAQDEASCVVFGMPREAINAGVVDVVVPLDQVAGAIVRTVRERKQ